MDNANTKEYLDKIRNQVVENLKRTAFAPSVQMTDVPRNPLVEGMDDDADDVLDDLDEDENKDKRFTQRRFDQYVEKPGELSESEDEEENAANGVRRQPNVLRRRNHANYRNLDAADSGLDSGMATPQEASSIADGEMDTGFDTNMTDVPTTEPETRITPSAAPAVEEPSASDADQMVVESDEKSVAVSQQPSAPPHDEDTTMEDAAEPAPSEPATTEAPEKKKSDEALAAPSEAEQPLSPSHGQSTADGASGAEAESIEAPAQAPAPGNAETEVSKEANAEPGEEATKKEE